MPAELLHNSVFRTYLLHMILRDLATPSKDVEEALARLQIDLRLLDTIRHTRYLHSRTQLPKAGNLHLLWEYADNPSTYDKFIQMVRVSPRVFWVILQLIEHHPVFTNSSQNPQTPVQIQLATTLFRLGRYGNAASLDDVARECGCSEGAVEDYTDRCFTAIESLHDLFVRPLTEAEKEHEKQWMESHLGFGGLWREGWLLYDGTIVVLYRRPGLNGDAYYTRKGTYGLNVQLGTCPSNLRIVDYSHGHTGSAHDAKAFEGTAASRYPDWFFKDDEFAWGDSAYTLTPRMMAIHKEPDNRIPENRLFDQTVSRFRVRSEHCMGALKGRFQCLRGLRVSINSKAGHIAAMRWVTVCIILHNLIIDVEGTHYGVPTAHGHAEEMEDHGPADVAADAEDEGEVKRHRLITELIAARQN